HEEDGRDEPEVCADKPGQEPAIEQLLADAGRDGQEHEPAKLRRVAGNDEVDALETRHELLEAFRREATHRTVLPEDEGERHEGDDEPEIEPPVHGGNEAKRAPRTSLAPPEG